MASPRVNSPFHYFVYGAVVSEVEVDDYTGEHRALRTDILHDVGDSISPAIDRGQIEGGFEQGVGVPALEELLWRVDGRVVTANAIHEGIAAIDADGGVIALNSLAQGESV